MTQSLHPAKTRAAPPLAADACRPEPRTPDARLAQRRRRLRRWLVGVVCLPAVVALGAGMFGLGAGPAVALWALGTIGAALALHPTMRLPGGVPVLTYHSVSRDAGWLPWAPQISIRPEVLDRQMGLLTRMGFTVIDDAELLRMRRFGAALPDTLAVLHFDDGYLDTRVAAWPILRRHGMHATLFVSTDFIDPSPGLRPTADQTAAPRWDGYLRWDELREMEASGVFTVEAHGTDHARVEVAPNVIGTLTRANWKHLAWKQWAADPGPKHDWYLHRDPPVVPLGSPLRPSAPALSARQWHPGGGSETPADYAARVSGVFDRCQRVFLQELGRPARIFCWPQNIASPAARSLARAAGFAATTGWPGRNAPGDPPDAISRIHIGQDWIGLRCAMADELGFRATLRCFQGNLYWGLVLMALGLVRRGVGLGRKARAAIVALGGRRGPGADETREDGKAPGRGDPDTDRARSSARAASPALQNRM